MDPKRDYTKGQSIIHHAIVAELAQKGIRGAVSNRTHGSGPRVPDTIFQVIANGKSEEMTFAYEEIKGSANGIDSFATTKVRMLVSRLSGS